MDQSSKHKLETAVVLLSYNSLPLVKDFLPKIIATVPKRSDIEIIVVDNASTDGTQEYVKENHPEVSLMRFDVNVGFTGGYLKSLAQIDAKNFVLISSDIEVTENWFESAIDLLNSSDDIAAVQPKVMSYDRRKEFEYAGAAGGYIDSLGYPFCKGRLINVLEEDEGQYDEVQEIFWASGACLFIKSEAWRAAEGFDKDFFAHMEEIDMCWRLKGMGYRIMYQPKSMIYHMGGFVIKYGSPQKIFRNHRNNLLMLIKNLPLSQLLWKIPVRLILDHVASLSMLKEKNPEGAIQVFKAHADILMNLGMWIEKRKATQATKTKVNNVGIYSGSLIVQFFLKGKRKFSELNWKP
ncbi:glycosyltransferase family 2 protein [bacterium SCSIO 12643]|nr:glycosyltransferase family 2 protein [bacterium SCSIO 12643]